MITEDYVSFETAKLLKKKGFEQISTTHRYDKTGESVYWTEIFEEEKYYSMPTQALVLKWLRVNHNIHITIDRMPKARNVFEFFYQIKTGDGFEVEPIYSGDFDTWEAACEQAIIYTLKNLIK